MTNGSYRFIECINTFQGEGPDSGKRVLLMRVKRCNKVEAKESCPWCDTLVKMRVQQEAVFSSSQLQDLIDKEKVGLMLTGGEPLYDGYYHQTKNILHKLNYPFANIETNGCNLEEFVREVPIYKDVKIIYSPKFFSKSEMKKEINKMESVWDYKNIYFKLVVDEFFKEHKSEVLSKLCKQDLNNRIYLMPQGSTKEELIQNFPFTIDIAEEFKVNISSREHLIYNFV